MSENIVVIGAGQAGLQIAESLRAEGFEGGVTLLGNEPLPPYQRPPLSKAWLQGETTEDRLILRGAPALEAKKIDLRLGSAVTEIDRAAKTVRLADGSSLAWTGLALATGARARRPSLPGAELEGVCVLRDIADAREIARRMETAQKIVVIGGGFIGLEVAATAQEQKPRGQGHRGARPADGPRRDARHFAFLRRIASRPWRRPDVFHAGRGARRARRRPSPPW